MAELIAASLASSFGTTIATAQLIVFAAQLVIVTAPVGGTQRRRR